MSDPQMPHHVYLDERRVIAVLAIVLHFVLADLLVVYPHVLLVFVALVAIRALVILAEVDLFVHVGLVIDDQVTPTRLVRALGAPEYLAATLAAGLQMLRQEGRPFEELVTAVTAYVR